MQAQMKDERTTSTRLTDFILTYPAKMNDFCVGLSCGGTLLEEQRLAIAAESKVQLRRGDNWVLEGQLGAGIGIGEYSFAYLPDVLEPRLYNLSLLYPREFNFVPADISLMVVFDAWNDRLYTNKPDAKLAHIIDRPIKSLFIFIDCEQIAKTSSADWQQAVP